MDPEELAEDAPLTADEVLTFGPCVEAQVWTPMWLQESRAPIAVAAGRPKLGRVFDDRGIGKAVIIRPCMSRGRRVRGLPPIYTQPMLEANASRFDGWPMFTDHVPPELAVALAKRGRSVKELAGQVLKGGWSREFVHEQDGDYGYQKGAVLAEAWATPLMRRTVDNNPNLLHTSINAWPTSGKPGPCPWRPAVKGMLIEGIRSQPQGSVDFVVRGGAGGRLLVAEGLEEEGAWPEIGDWPEADRRFVVSLAESFYASPRMTEIALPSKPDELKDWLAEHAAHLLPALEAAASDDDADDKPKAKKVKNGTGGSEDSSMSESLTEADVRQLIAEASSGTPTVEDFESHLREQTELLIAEREEHRVLSERAHRLIEAAEGIPATWKRDLKARYSVLPSGPSQALLVEAATDEAGNELTATQVLEAAVQSDISHVLDLIAEAKGKPRVTGEGGQSRDSSAERSGKNSGRGRAGASFWRERFADFGIAESADKAIEVFGGKVEG